MHCAALLTDREEHPPMALGGLPVQVANILKVLPSVLTILVSVFERVSRVRPKVAAFSGERQRAGS